ncbi:MAG TPA: hypothetical protein VFQ60_02325 [Patescibacteria group bacterium]|nr:hypothetical protein [Patescibacteria group bacterium]
MAIDPQVSQISVNPPSELMEKILERIERGRIHQLWFRLILSLSGAVLSLGYVLFNWAQIQLELQQSSFFSLLKLVSSDSDILLANIKSYLLGLLESVPVDLVLFLGILLFSILCLISFLASARRVHVFHVKHGEAHS